MYIYVIFDPNQVRKPQGNKVVQYFKILNSVATASIMQRSQAVHFDCLEQLKVGEPQKRNSFSFISVRPRA